MASVIGLAMSESQIALSNQSQVRAYADQLGMQQLMQATTAAQESQGLMG